MKRFIFLFWLFGLLVFSGCSDVDVPTPEPPAASQSVQMTQPECESEPLPTMSDGNSITVNGQRLPDGSWSIDGVLYVRLWSLAAALDAELHWDGADATLLWQDETYKLEANSAQLQTAGELLTLDGPMHWILDQAYVPVISLCQHLELHCFDDEEQGHLYFTPGVTPFEIPAGYRVPVLMYHGVSDDTWGSAELFVSPSELEKQLQYLQENGYTTVHFSDLAHIDEIERPVLLTFDDGYLDNYTELLPLLQQYDAKATVFVITDSLDNHEKFMTWEQVAHMADSGLVSIQSHTVDHSNLDTLTAEQQAEQLAQSKLAIVRHTGFEPYVLCYPTGRYNQDTLDCIGDYYQFGLKMNGEDYITGDHVFEINRWYVSRYTDISRFAYMVGK